MAVAYSFVSTWHVPAGAARSWAELERMLSPATGTDGTWWPGLAVVDPPAALAPGESLTLAVRSPLGYRLRVRLTITDVDPRRALAATSMGDLRGAGRVEIRAVGDAASVVVFHWDVVTERRWMNATAFALRPAFERAHAHVMREGERGLRTSLGAR